MLLKFDFIVSVIGTVLLYVFDVINKIYMIPLIFLAMFLGIILVWGLSCIIATRFIDFEKDYDEYSPFYRFYVDCIVQSLNQIFNIKLHVSGEECIPEEKFLFVCNHRSAMDPLITMSVTKKYNLGFVAKKDIYKIPVISRLMHRSFCLKLDREDVKRDALTIIRAGKLVKEQKASIGIYPEGTRNKEEGGLLPFHNGAFKIGKKAKCPIVVATIKNPELIFKKPFFVRKHVYLDYIGVLDKEFVAEHNTAEISDTVRDMMLAKINSDR